MKLTPLQTLVANEYCGGDFAHITELDEAEDCGDTLFTFCIREANDAGTVSEMLYMLGVAIRDLRRLSNDLLLAELAGGPS